MVFGLPRLISWAALWRCAGGFSVIGFAVDFWCSHSIRSVNSFGRPRQTKTEVSRHYGDLFHRHSITIGEACHVTIHDAMRVNPGKMAEIDISCHGVWLLLKARLGAVGTPRHTASRGVLPSNFVRSRFMLAPFHGAQRCLTPKMCGA